MDTTPIYDITPFTALDYPEHLAAIFWFAGCNMRCSYCYNPDIVLGEGSISHGQALDFLKKRRGMLEGVVLSGGEATLYAGLLELCQEIKTLGYKIKLDTNGANPTMLLELLKKSVLDYVALDYKAPKQKFQAITKNKHFDHFSLSLSELLKRDVAFEVRTTVCSELLSAEDINHIMHDLSKRGYKGKYYLQRYIEDTPHLGRMKKQKQQFETEKLSAQLDIVWR